MRAVIQRVQNASVRVPAEDYISSIGHGLLVLAAFIDEDTDADLEWTAKKIAGMRIFDDEAELAIAIDVACSVLDILV